MAIQYINNSNDGGDPLGEKSKSALNVQKARVIDLWSRCCLDSKNDVPQDVKTEVLSKLVEGLVPPIFHAYASGKRLYPSNVKRLSAAQVGSGSAVSRESSKFTPVMKNYESVFFSENGKAIPEVNDTGLSSGDPTWHFDKSKTTEAVELVNATGKMLGEDVEATDIPSSFSLRPLDGRKLLTRRLSRGVVADCFELSKSGSELAIVGSPGIGKSWTLVYALQQALLYDGACVAFFQPKVGIASLYIRKSNTIYAWTSGQPL